jgi:sugar O-acyltransferase (sialic acid O-acetyltransferase NeuD family)
VKSVLVLGAGGHGQIVADILLAMAREGCAVEAVGFLDDDASLHGKTFLGIPVLGPRSALRSFHHDSLVVAIGDNRKRSLIVREVLESGERLVSAIHPKAVIARDVSVGAGSMICAGVVVNTATFIGEAAILNTGSTVDHHNAVGPYSHIAPGAHLGGNVTIAEGAFIGIGAAILPRCRVGAWATVGGGAAVTRDVPDGQTVVGVPARPLQRT